MSQHSKWNTEDRTFPPVTPQTVLSPQEARAYNTLIAGRRVSEIEWMIHQMALRVSGDYGVPRRPHLPKPGDDVEAWLKSHRDRWTRAPYPHTMHGMYWQLLDRILNDYRKHANAVIPLVAAEAQARSTPKQVVVRLTNSMSGRSFECTVSQGDEVIEVIDVN